MTMAAQELKQEQQQQSLQDDATQMMPPPPAPVVQANGRQQQQQPQPQADNGLDSMGKAAGGVNRRRSNVVKEVERLKKNREERRAKQAEILEEKSTQKNIDPGNPNWEFLCMIREYQEQLEYNPLNDNDVVTDHQISVCVRKRPLSNKENKKKEVNVITCPNKDQVIIHEPKTKVDVITCPNKDQVIIHE